VFSKVDAEHDGRGGSDFKASKFGGKKEPRRTGLETTER
jgi:hypothetical protein